MEHISIDEDLELIRKLCGEDHDLRISASRLFKREYGRTTPQMAVHSAKRSVEMWEEQKRSRKTD